jgi:hypothetical protein
MGILANAMETVAAREAVNGEKPLITLNPLKPDEYPYFEDDLSCVADCIPWGEGDVTYDDLGKVVFMVEFYVGRENNGECDYLYIENNAGDGWLFIFGWGCPASLNHVEITEVV